MCSRVWALEVYVRDKYWSETRLNNSYWGLSVFSWREVGRKEGREGGRERKQGKGEMNSLRLKELSNSDLYRRRKEKPDNGNVSESLAWDSYRWVQTVTFTVRNNNLCTQFSCVIVCVVLADISMRLSVCSTQFLGSVVYTGRWAHFGFHTCKWFLMAQQWHLAFQIKNH